MHRQVRVPAKFTIQAMGLTRQAASNRTPPPDSGMHSRAKKNGREESAAAMVQMKGLWRRQILSMPDYARLDLLQKISLLAASWQKLKLMLMTRRGLAAATGLS